MAWLRDLPIRRKLTLVILLACAMGPTMDSMGQGNESIATPRMTDWMESQNLMAESNWFV